MEESEALLNCLDDNALAAYIDGGLSDEQRRFVDRHLSSCSACRCVVSDCARGLPEEGQGYDVGEWVGKYRLEALVGRGSMGIVYRATDVELGRSVAIKFLAPKEAFEPSKASFALGSNQDVVAELRREALTLARLNHPNVVSVFEIGVLAGQSFVAMEFVNGRTLTQWLRGNRTWRERVEVLLQVGAGLMAAHRAGVVHRDVKPSNVLIDENGWAKLVDFGLARTQDEHQTVLMPPGGKQVVTSVAGTLAYLAPEVKTGGAATPLSDQYSFCVMAYEALQGTRPAECPKAIDGVPKAVSGAVVRGLAVKPAERFDCMESLCAAMDKGLQPRRWLPAVAVGTTIVLLAVVSTVLLASKDAPCPLATDLLERHWNASTRTSVTDALSRIERPYAKETAKRVVALWDKRGGQWLRAQQETCRATQRGEQSAALLDVRMACFQRQLEALSEQVQVIVAQPTAETLDHAMDAANALLRPMECQGLDLRRLGSQPLPSTQLRALVDRAQALRRAGRYGDAVTAARKALQRARSEKAERSIAVAGLTLAMAERELQRPDESLQALASASTAAANIGDERLLIELWTERIVVEGIEKNNVEAGQAWSTATNEKLTLAYSHDRGLKARVWGTIGRFHSWASHEVEAEEFLGKALEASSHLEAQDYAIRAAILGTAADFWRVQGNLDSAVAALEEGIALLQQNLVPGHPQIAAAKNLLASVFLEQGRGEESQKVRREALESLIGSFGEQHPALFETQLRMSETLMSLGQTEDALVHAEHCLSIVQKHPNAARRPRALAIYGRALYGAGKVPEALDALTEAVQLMRNEYGESHRAVGAMLVSLGVVQKELGKLEDAEASFVEAKDINEALSPEGSSTSASIWHNLGEGLLRGIGAGTLHRTFSAHWSSFESKTQTIPISPTLWLPSESVPLH